MARYPVCATCRSQRPTGRLLVGTFFVSVSRSRVSGAHHHWGIPVGNLRERAAGEAAATTETGCPLWGWLNGFEGDDRAFLVEVLESDKSGRTVYLNFKRWELPPVGQEAIREHRGRRCLCGPDIPGRKA